MTIFDGREIKEETADSLLELMKGDVDAVMFCMELLYTYHVWDDLVDKDKPRTSEEISQAFFFSLSNFNHNPFYLRYQSRLIPLIESSILQWLDSNELEKSGDEQDLHKAYMLRAFIIQIWGYCVFLVGGIDHYRSVGSLVQSLYCEVFNDYVEEMREAAHA